MTVFSVLESLKRSTVKVRTAVFERCRIQLVQKIIVHIVNDAAAAHICGCNQLSVISEYADAKLIIDADAVNIFDKISVVITMRSLNLIGSGFHPIFRNLIIKLIQQKNLKSPYEKNNNQNKRNKRRK